jgi:solute carrier family 12 sodium/potassium/chloride transporter 2
VSINVLSEAFSSDTDSPPVTPKMRHRGSVNCDPAASENLLEPGTTVNIISKKSPKLLKNQKSDIPKYVGPGGEPLPASILNSITRFQRKQPKGLIDVWWLYDDGGMLSQDTC